MTIWLLLLLGCPGKHKQPTGVDGVERAITEVRPRGEGRTVAGPMRWTDREGLCLDVPVGWSGVTEGEGALLELTSIDSGVEVRLIPGGPLDSRPGYEATFVDHGAHRRIPALGHASTATFVSDDPKGPTLQVWWGTTESGPVRVEVRYPYGSVVAGRNESGALLERLTGC